MTQAAAWLDTKRTYMALRPKLRRMYVVVRDVLDFGPGSIDGWLAGLIAGELGLDTEQSLDAEARELVVHGHPVPLTPLEFGLFDHLRQREGRTVSRYELLRDVWGTEFTGGSNVVDAVVRSLRRNGRGGSPRQWLPAPT